MDKPSTKSQLIDITVSLSPDTQMWPDAPRFQFEQTKTDLGGGEVATSSIIRTSVHCGTHIDAPLHFNGKGKSIDEIDLGLLMGPCLVLEHAGENHISKNDLLAMGFVPAKRILIKTRNSFRPRTGEFDTKFISLLPDAIEHLMQAGVKVLGVDAFSIDACDVSPLWNHIHFCKAGGIIIEVLDLSKVEPGKYQLIALPVKLKGIEGSLARVLLLRPEEVRDVFSDE